MGAKAMTDFKEFTQSDSDEKIPEPNWSIPSKALIACNNGVGCVLYHTGAHIDAVFNETGTHCLADLGLDDAPDGLSVWEGKLHGRTIQTMDGTEYESELRGTFRDLTTAEWQGLRDGDPFSEDL